ncbi:hypothetical protein JAAARDRAFT_30420 [Jaapia argillacea MUCL 33604]|uniref:Uncharacterized protein n=1 Tax=Jaapia argillacea MUCL 33604 TaxID=933084 RepID=A0A067QIT0_9AGAM|nr:hypothetical protein JAAARDRAFT_30420 [Jaapia argillacea MUCL 33604]
MFRNVRIPLYPSFHVGQAVRRTSTGPKPKQWMPHDSPNIGPSDDAIRPLVHHRLSKFLIMTMIPFALGYQIFVHDFGDHEHVFQPARRWVARQKASFFNLSPAERHLVVTEIQQESSSGKPESAQTGTSAHV